MNIQILMYIYRNIFPKFLFQIIFGCALHKDKLISFSQYKKKNELKRLLGKEMKMIRNVRLYFVLYQSVDS